MRSSNETLERAASLMMDFAERTGLTREGRPRRYLWTDAFAVCNFLGLARRLGDKRYTELALQLVDQVGSELVSFWCDREHQQTRAWSEHRDINEVMLATSPLPEAFLVLSSTG